MREKTCQNCEFWTLWDPETSPMGWCDHPRNEVAEDVDANGACDDFHTPFPNPLLQSKGGE